MVFALLYLKLLGCLYSEWFWHFVAVVRSIVPEIVALAVIDQLFLAIVRLAFPDPKVPLLAVFEVV
jgi:hypothetical protein